MTQTLSSNKINRLASVFGEALRRFKSAWILYSLLLVVLGPVFLTVQLANRRGDPFEGLSTELLFYLTALVMACVFPLLLFSHLNNRQALDIYHALPITRGRFYWGRVLAGLGMLMVPYLVLGIGCGVVCQAIDPENRLLNNLVNMAPIVLALYAGMVFIIINCGTLFESIAYFSIIQLAYPCCILVFSSFLGWITFGWDELAADGLIRFLLDFSPGYQLFFKSASGRFWSSAQLLLVTVAALIGGMALYRNRKSESAGSSFAYKPLFYGAALVSSITVGLGVILLLEGVRGQIIVGIIVGVLCYFILDTIRNRGLGRAKETAAVSFAAVAAVGMFFGLAQATGTFGYETYLPPAEGVRSVAVQWRVGENYLCAAYPLTELEDIQRVEEFHQSVTANQEQVQLYSEIANQEQPNWAQETPGDLTDSRFFPFQLEGASPYAFGDCSVELIYTMLDGRKVRRSYTDVPLALTLPLYETAKGEGYRRSQLETLRALQDSPQLDNKDDWSLYTVQGVIDHWEDPTKEQLCRILEAAAADLEKRSADRGPYSGDKELFVLHLDLGGDEAAIELPVFETDTELIQCLTALSLYPSPDEMDREVLDEEIQYTAALIPLTDYQRYLQSDKADGSIFYFAGQYCYWLQWWYQDFLAGQYQPESCLVTESQLEQLMALCSHRYISETPLDVLLIDGENYLIYPGMLAEVEAILEQGEAL